MVKLELLDSKHVQHLTDQLSRLITGLAAYHLQCQELMHGKQWFPIELDLIGTALTADHNETCYHVSSNLYYKVIIKHVKIKIIIINIFLVLNKKFQIFLIQYTKMTFAIFIILF